MSSIPNNPVIDAAFEPQDPIRAYRSRLPSLDALSPYLRYLDKVRNYSNFGELNLTLARRLAVKLEVSPDNVVLASSGTSALVGAILGAAGRATGDRPLCLVQSFTFSATAAAAELCGYTVHLVDVEHETWMLDPTRIASHPLIEQVGLVLPVCPFGKWMDQSEWSAFTRTTGIPVVIDAAASFEALLTGCRELTQCPIALSFHASKAYSTGEGGAVVCKDTAVTESAARAMNFGMFGERCCRSAGFNGKMSEYHAAVGLAELDGWQDKSRQFGAVVEIYRRAMSDRGLSRHLVTAPEIASCYMLYRADSPEQANDLRAELDRRAIEHRLWYGQGLHREPYFANAPRDSLPSTEQLASSLIGLPMAPDLSEKEVIRIADAAAEVSK